MIYDCFSYWDEDLLLDLRLNILDNYVDYFVIVEGNKTWQNNPKKLRFEIDKFKKFKNKIVYVPVTDLPDGEDPYLRENHQRNWNSLSLRTVGSARSRNSEPTFFFSDEPAGRKRGSM